MIQPTQAQLTAACAAARQAVENYSEFDSSMIPDSALQAVVSKALVAALNIPHPVITPKGN
jgi:hypothetical protein